MRVRSQYRHGRIEHLRLIRNYDIAVTWELSITSSSIKYGRDDLFTLYPAQCQVLPLSLYNLASLGSLSMLLNRLKYCNAWGFATVALA